MGLQRAFIAAYEYGTYGTERGYRRLPVGLERRGTGLATNAAALSQTGSVADYRKNKPSDESSDSEYNVAEPRPCPITPALLLEIFNCKVDIFDCEMQCCVAGFP